PRGRAAGGEDLHAAAGNHGASRHPAGRHYLRPAAGDRRSRGRSGRREDLEAAGTNLRPARRPAEDTISWPPLKTIVASPVPVEMTVCLPPFKTVVAKEVPPEAAPVMRNN